MFALWYLSLALDEMRKRFGWTFFDIFKSKPTTAALDNKPSTSSAAAANNALKAAAKPAPAPTPEPAKPEPTVIKPEPVVVKPVVKPEPAKPEPVKTEPTKPEPVKPEPVKPEPTKPVPAVAKPEPTVKPTPEVVAKPELSPLPTPAPVVSKPEPTVKMPVPEPIQVPVVAPELKPTTPNKSQIEKPNEITNESPKMPPLAPIIADIKSPVIADVKPPIAPKPILNGAGSNGTDALDRKIFDASKPFTNGEATMKANLKDATNDFLAGEAKTSPMSMKTMEGRTTTDTMVDAAVLTKLEEGFAKLAASDSKSLLKKYLTKEVFDSLKNKKTPTFGSTLLDCIQSGLENHDSGVGIYAPDAEAYLTFAELFDPIIEDYHGGFKKTDKHPAREFGDVSCFGNLDPNNEFVISTRVRCGRSMQGYPFNPCLTEAQYKEMEQKVSTTLSGLEGELKGKFYPLTGMEKTVQQQLIDDHFLFKEGDRFLQTANACRYWPSGRGIYHNDKKTFLVWCNEEDHLRIISMQMGGDLGEVYRRLTTAVNDIEKRIPFSHDDRLGFLTFCPTNLGTTIRASVHIKVPKLAANMAKLEEVAGKYNLQVRGTRGEHTEAEGGVYDISNKRRMGLTEFDAVKEMYDGIAELIKLEKAA